VPETRPAPYVPGDLPEPAAWVAAAGRTRWIPPEFAAYELSLPDAAARLRAPRELVRRLVDAGLPSDVDGEHVDANDVFNLALELRWPAALPVTAFRGALRWLLRPLPELLAPQPWRCELTAPPQPRQAVHVARPAPQIYGGSWEPDADGPPAASDPRFRLEPGRTVGGVATLPGRRNALPGEARRQLRAVLDSGHRWAKLPLALQSRPDVVAGLGYATCVSVSLQLSAALRAAGYPARTRRGYLIAPVATGHSWVEVAGDDGWTVLDPVLVLLHRRLAELEPAARDRPEPELADGLLVNRVLASALPADEPLAVTGNGDAVEIATAFRRLDPAQPTQDREATPG
jgi:Transglutaminase-like superfamily